MNNKKLPLQKRIISEQNRRVKELFEQALRDTTNVRTYLSTPR
jgi:hypothetical protein